MQALVSEIINKLELACGTVTSFDILMQNFYKLQQGRTEAVTLHVAQLKETLNVIQQEYLTVLSINEVQQNLRDRLFDGLCKQLRDLMWYLYDDARRTYPQLVTSAQKAESEHKDHSGESIWMTSVQAEGRMI